MKKYAVEQGNMNSMGIGDTFRVGTFDTLSNAQKCMRAIYNDTKGYTKYPNGFIETFIIEIDTDNEDYFDIVESMRHYYYKGR